MLQFKFGLAWTCLTTAVLIWMVFIPQETRTGGPMSIPLALFLVALEGVGVYFIVKGLETVIKDRKTDKFGDQTIGRILDISPTGSDVNGRPELKATIVAYLPEYSIAKVFYEIIGTAPAKIDVGSYVTLKYFDDDVNIIKKLAEENVPENIAKVINEKHFKTNIKLDKNGEAIDVSKVNIPDVANLVGASEYLESFDDTDW